MCQSAWPYVPIPESGSARLNSPAFFAARTRSALSRPRHALDPVQRCPERTRAPAVLPSAPGKLGLARTFWLLEAHRNRRHGTRSCAFGGGKFPAWVRADALALLPGAEWLKIWPGAFGCLTKAFLRPPPAQTNHARGGIPVGGFGHPPPGRGGKGGWWERWAKPHESGASEGGENFGGGRSEGMVEVRQRVGHGAGG